MEFIKKYIEKAFHNATARQVVAYSVFLVLITFILFGSFSASEVTLKPGQISPRNIRAPQTTVIIDEEKTRELKRQAASRVQKIYQENRNAASEALQDVYSFFEQVEAIRNLEVEEDEKLNRMQAYLISVMREKRLGGYDAARMARYLVSATSRDIDSMKGVAVTIVRDEMGKPITDEALNNVQQTIKSRTSALAFVPEAQKVVEVCLIKAIRPNLIYDVEATAKAIEEAESRVMPVQRTIKQGQIIVREGDPVTQEHIEILRQLGIQRSRSYAITLGGTFLIVLIFTGLFLSFLRLYHPQVFTEGKMVLLVGVVSLIILGIARALLIIKVGERPEINALIGYLVPISAGSMLIAILVSEDIALFVTMLMAVFLGLLIQGNQIPYVITAFAGGAAGVFRVSKLKQTGDLVKAGLYVAGVNIIAVLSLSLIFSDMTLQVSLMGGLFAALNGFLSAVLTIGLLPYLETVFSLTSAIKLLELANPNQELLRRMLVEAPGTYHHSIMVGNLAEAAAERIGADTLLVRVGAYFHDIGKLKRPYFFVENQLGNENPHDKIAPSLSALIITTHIKDGVELAKENRLPRSVIDFIEQHHGTSLVKYFYSRALQEDQDRVVKEEAYRYEGPKPQSKEVALVMLADSVEAAVRSLQDPTPGRIEGMVRRIIKDKLYDGQLEESDLTFRDLDIIAESFAKVLNGVYHSRIEYPENLMRELESKEREL